MALSRATAGMTRAHSLMSPRLTRSPTIDVAPKPTAVRSSTTAQQSAWVDSRSRKGAEGNLNGAAASSILFGTLPRRAEPIRVLSAHSRFQSATFAATYGDSPFEADQDGHG